MLLADVRDVLTAGVAVCLSVSSFENIIELSLSVTNFRFGFLSLYILFVIYLFIYLLCRQFFVSGLFFTPLVTFVNLNQIVTTSVSSLLTICWFFPLVASHVRSVFHRSSSEFQVYKDWLSVWTFVACKRRICRNSALRSCSVCFCPSVRIKSVHI